MKIWSPVIRVLGTMHTLSIHLLSRTQCKVLEPHIYKSKNIGEARWPSGRVSDSGARGRGFAVLCLLAKTHLLPEKYW